MFSSLDVREYISIIPDVTDDINIDDLVKVVFSRFLYWKVISSFAILFFWKIVTKSSLSFMVEGD